MLLQVFQVAFSETLTLKNFNGCHSCQVEIQNSKIILIYNIFKISFMEN